MTKKTLRLLCSAMLLGLLPGAAKLQAQTPPAFFINLSTSQVAAGNTPAAAGITTITPPGAGWTYSAAAPVTGTTWNNILRPNPSIGSNSTSTVGEYVCNSANDIALTSATGATDTGARLSIWIDIRDLEGNTTRTEPNSSTAGNTVLGPSGLMGQCWRIYRGGNGSIHRFSGLVPSAHYYLYAYGTTTTTGQGCKFTLEAANVPAGAPAFVDVRGGNSGNIFTTDGSTYSLTAPATPGVASTASDNNSWGRLHAVADSAGVLIFRTAKNANNGQYLNGYQLMPYPVAVFTLSPPASASATVGGALTLPTTATGDGTLTYQWRKGGAPLTDGASGTGSTYAGVNTPSLTISGVSVADDGDYDVVVTNPGGSVPSSSSAVTITSDAIAPSIIADPLAATAITGGAVAFSVSANGTAPLAYQWEKSLDNVDFAPVPDATSSVLNLTALTTAAAGYYRVVVTNSVGSATSATAPLTIAPVISTAPLSTIVPAGAPHTISVVADAGPGSPQPIAYLWKRDGATVSDGGGVSGSATASLAVGGFGAAQSGYYTVTVSNTAGAVTSAPVYVGVASTQGVTFAPGDNATGIAIDQQLRLVFPSAPRLGQSGAFRIHDAADGTVVVTIDRASLVGYTLFSATVVNAAIQPLQGKSVYYLPVAIYGNEVWLTLPAAQRLAYAKTYYVTMDAGFLLDSANAAVPAITSPTTWNFSTKVAGPATPTATTGPVELTVGLDGAGDFATIQGASDWIPQNNTLPRTIRIRPGVYRDTVYFGQNRNFVTLLGTGPRREDVVIYHPYPAEVNGAGARGLGTLRLDSHDVTVRDLTVDNQVYVALPSVAGAAYPSAPAFAGPIQTVATTGNRLVFDNVLIKGGQDTLYTISGIAYFYNCEIWGSVDFIYGDALAVFDRCDIVEIRNTGGPICAPSTPHAQPYGEVFLNCRFPRALVADGYPYDVGVGTTTFCRPWRQDGMVAIINSQLGAQFSTKGWSEWDGRENTSRAREYGNTLIAGGGPAPTPAQRRAAGAYWLNTLDPDYTSGAMSPTDPLLTLGAGSANRVPVTVDPADYTLEAIFGHPYFALSGWLPAVNDFVAPVIGTNPGDVTSAIGQSVTFTVAATGSPVLTYQWFKGVEAISGQTSASYTIPSVDPDHAGAYHCVVTNDSGFATSASATLVVLTPLAAWADDFGLDGAAPGFASADADGDGVANLLEYVLGGDPTLTDTGLAPEITVIADAEDNHLVLQYRRAVAAAAVPTSVEISSDLVGWTTLVDGVNAEIEIIPSLGDGLNVDINTSAANNYTGLAAAPGAGLVWNSLLTSTPALTDLLASSGTPTTTDLTLTSSGGFSSWNQTTNGAPNPALLMQDYLFGNTYTVTLGSLPQGAYQLYVYAHGDQDNQTATVTVAAANGGGTRTTTASGGAGFRDAFAPGAEGIAYVKFTPAVGASGTLQFSAGNYLNGFQLVQVLDPDHETVRVTIPFTGARLFARLRATAE